MKQLAIISGKGGTGKTSLTAALASIAENAVFADCDIEAADLHLIFQAESIEKHEFSRSKKVKIVQDECIRCGLCFNLCRFDAIDRIRNKYYVREFSCEACDLCRKACPVMAIEQIESNMGEYYVTDSRFGKMVYGQLGVGEEISGELISHVRENARDIGQENKNDYLIIDGPPGIGINAISSIIGSDLVIIIAEPTQSGLHDLERAYQLVDSYDIDSKVIINKWNLNENMSGEIESFCNKIGIDVLIKLPFDRNIAYAMFEQKSIIEYSTDSEISILIKNTWENIQSSLNEKP